MQERGEQRGVRDPLTYKVLGAYFGVYRALGWGFLEGVYRRAMCVELARFGLTFSTEASLPVYHRDVLVGDYRADLIVEGAIIVELKVASRLDDSHRAQLLNYLKATNIEKGLLLNFGPRPSYQRLLLTNDRKTAVPLKF